MHVSGIFADYQKADIDQRKADIEEEKADIEQKKADIKEEKADIGILEEYGDLLFSFSARTIEHAQQMSELFGKNTIFGRGDVQAVTGLKHTRASGLLNILSEAKVIEPVTGHGKGKYKFSQYTSLPK